MEAVLGKIDSNVNAPHSDLVQSVPVSRLHFAVIKHVPIDVSAHAQ